MFKLVALFSSILISRLIDATKPHVRRHSTYQNPNEDGTNLLLSILEGADLGKSSWSSKKYRNQAERSLVSGDINVAYVGTRATKAWVSVPVPYKDAQNMTDVMSFHGSPAVKGTVVGVHTVFYDILLDLSVGANLVGDIAPPGNIAVPTAFVLSSWVADDLSRLFPIFDIVSNGQHLQCNPPVITRELNTVAHLLYKVVTRCGGVVTEFYANLFNDQEVIEWQLFAVFSDYSVPDVDINIEKFSVTFGEFIMVDDHIPLQVPQFSIYDSATDTFTITLIDRPASDPLKIGHAQGLPIFKGALLCIDNSKPFEVQIRDPEITSSEKYSYLLARIDGKILSGRTNWDNRWLAFQAAIPKLPQDTAELDSIFNAQYGFMSTPQDLYAKRLLGLNKYAGSTGAQGDFGSQKGSQATHGDIRFSATWHYHLQEPMRPIHFREANGSPTTGAVQDNWVTWSQITHYHPNVSPNQLGKPNWWTGGEFHGWSGKDDQHKSSNALNAAIATMDWPAHRTMLRDEINVALENVRFLPGQDPGAPRAIGRRLLADANAFLLTGDEWVWERLVVWHASNAFTKSVLGPAPDFMRVQEFSMNDKPPFLCVETTNCVQGQHAPVAKIIIWQLGLLMKGLVAAWNTHLYRQSLGLPTLAGTDDLEDHIAELATTFARHFVVQVNGAWQTWNLIAWNNGVPVDPGILSSNDETAGSTYELVKVDNTWWEWIFPGFYYLARSDHGINLPLDVVQRLDSMATETEMVVFPNSNMATREWFPFTA